MPSVQVIPTRLPAKETIWAIIRVVVVLPFVPVTQAIGIRPFCVFGKRFSSTAIPIRWAIAGDKRQNASRSGRGVTWLTAISPSVESATISTTQISSPTTREASAACDAQVAEI